MGIFAASNIFSMNMTYPSVGSATHNQAKRVCKLAYKRASADCSASAPKTEQSKKCRRASGEVRKEHHVRDRTHKLAVL